MNVHFKTTSSNVAWFTKEVILRSKEIVSHNFISGTDRCFLLIEQFEINKS